MSPQETILVVLIAALSLAAVYLLLRLFSARYGKGQGESRDGIRIERRQIGTSWHISLKSRDFPTGLRIGRPPSPEPYDLVNLRGGRDGCDGLAAWGPGAKRRLRPGTTLNAAWNHAEGAWSLANGTLDVWVREPRSADLRRRLDARVEEGLRLAALLRTGEAP